ncbi:hypothetical protein CDAR_393571 [Caerostris darwini]|uniref:Uncharacterized protein n=1 Tax=Caerostris darwini TaxID=1538125 RepID=A0AAV4W8Q4_9ARAC|nr:hypothetical protein CDAR_393571 [Caerostris darwini]
MDKKRKQSHRNGFVPIKGRASCSRKTGNPAAFPAISASHPFSRDFGLAHALSGIDPAFCLQQTDGHSQRADLSHFSEKDFFTLHLVTGEVESVRVRTTRARRITSHDDAHDSSSAFRTAVKNTHFTKMSY